MSKAPFSNKPGRHERHLLRKLDNPLFPRPVIAPSDEEILEVQAPFRVLVGGTAARQAGTSDAVAARTPIFAGAVLLVVVALMAWLLRSVSAALRGAILPRSRRSRSGVFADRISRTLRTAA